MRKIIVLVVLVFLVSDLSAQILVRGKTLLEYDSKPGEVVEDSIFIENKAEEKTMVSIFIDNKTHKGNKQTATAWIQLESSRYIIPHGVVKVPFKTRVPENVEGTYWTDIVVRPEQATTVGKSKVFIQYAIKVIINTGEGATIPIIKSIGYEKEKKVLKVSIENNSDFIDLVKVSVEIDSQKIEMGEKRIYPHFETEFSVPHKLEDGLYESTVFVELSDGNIVGKKIEFRVGLPPPPPPKPVTLAKLPTGNSSDEHTPIKKNHFTLIIQPTYGSRRRSLSLSSSLRINKFFLSSGVQSYQFLGHYFYERTGESPWIMRKFASAGLSFNGLRVSSSVTQYQNYLYYGGTLSFNTRTINTFITATSRQGDYFINGQVGLKVFKEVQLTGQGFFTKDFQDWQLGLRIPVTTRF